MSSYAIPPFLQYENIINGILEYSKSLRKIELSELRADCPFMPEEDQFETYLTALEDDIRNLDVVISLFQDSGYLM